MIKKALFFFCSIALNLHICTATTIIPSNQGKCDSIITVEGKTYIVEILREDAREVQFSLCNEPTGSKYVITNERIREIRRANGKITKPIEDYPVLETTPLIKRKPKPSPSIIESEPTNEKKLEQDFVCEILTFPDGKSLEVRIVEEDNFNYFYMICGNTDDTVYIAPIKQVRLEKKKSPRERKKTGCLLIGLVVVGLIYLIAFAIQLIGG